MSTVPMNPDVQRRFMYLFERIGEPLNYSPRGNGTSLTFFNMPTEQCAEAAHASSTIMSDFQSMRMNEIRVGRPTNMPNLSGISGSCPRSALYNYFNPNHRRAVRELREILLRQGDLQSLLDMACACRDNETINPKVWVNAFASCLLNRPDTRGFRMPAVWEILPDMFFGSFCLKKAERQGVLPLADRAVIDVQETFSGRDTNPENRLAYFREDLGINSHHWHWHLIYTLDAPRGTRDRKGELFYFMHHEMTSRYEAERLGNGMARTETLIIDQEMVKEGYFPKLQDTNSSQLWGSRQINTPLKDVNRLDDVGGPRVAMIEQMKKFRDRIMEAIDTNMVLTSTGQRMPLNIDVLGDMVESSELTPNGQFYGDVGLHNLGHILIAFAHDPQARFRENSGVMGDTGTAMRDPVFYRWHKYIDNLFDLHKQILQPYSPDAGENQLAWAGITVDSVQVQSQRQGIPANVFSTFRTQSHVDLSRGMDFLRTRNNLGPVFVRTTHLNHDPFDYRIQVTNNGATERSGTVRIFLAPRLNEHNQQFPLDQQRRLFFTLDKFSVQLRPGRNEITRNSTQSTVTIPWEQTFRDLESRLAQPTAEQSVCGCGWPQHMLIPRGNTTGQVYDLVVFVTNGDEDRVQQPATAGNQGANQQRNNCRDSVSYCGLLNQLYPDRKPMGYPFDRTPYTVPSPNDPNGRQAPVGTLEAFITRVPNMRAVQTRIIYNPTRIDMRNDGVSPNMRVVNGDPSMPMTGNVCATATATPGTTQPPRAGNGRMIPTSGASSPPRSRPSSPTPAPMQTSPPVSPVASGSSTSSRRVPAPQQGSWGRQPQQQSPQSRPESPNGGWTHINRHRPASPNWGWGWQG